MTDVIEAPFDVTFQHPHWRTFSTEQLEAPLYRVGRGSFWSESK